MENSGSAFVVSQFQSFLVLLIEKITTKTKQAVPKQNPTKPLQSQCIGLEHLWTESSLHRNDTSPMAIDLDLMRGITSRAENLYFIPSKFPLNFTMRVTKVVAKVLTSLWRWKWGCCSCSASSLQTHLKCWYQLGVCSVLEQLCKRSSEVSFVLFLPAMSYVISGVLSIDINILPWIYLIK